MVTTAIAIRTGAEELNPLGAWLFSNVGLFLGLALTAIVSFSIILLTTNLYLKIRSIPLKQFWILILIIVAGLRLVVMVFNLKELIFH